MKGFGKFIGCLLAVSLVIMPMSTASIGILAQSAAEGATRITDLTTEYQKDPIGIDVSTPRFGWRMESSRIGQMQAGYEINLYRAADPANPIWTKAEKDDRSVGIVYDGPTLDMATAYFWTVDVAASDGQTYTSQPGYFETGVTDLPEWRNAKFIQLGSNTAAPVFRTEGRLEGEVREARLYITALGAYQAYINGDQVAQVNRDGTVTYPHMAPGYGNGQTAWYYQTYDVTAHLKGQEAFALAVLAGTGWYNGQMAAMSGAPAIKALLRIVYDDGRTAYLDTNLEDWKATLEGGIRKQGIYYGEWYDANAEAALGDYKNPGYDDSGWIGAGESGPSHVIENNLEGVRARYLRLRVDALGPQVAGEYPALQIMELEVLDRTGEDVALHKTAWSPQGWEPVDNWRNAYLTDGEDGTGRDYGFTTVFNPAKPIYVTVDLGAEYDLSALKIHCRSLVASEEEGVCPNYPKEYTVQTARESDFAVGAQPAPGYDDAASTGWTDVLSWDAGRVGFTLALSEASYPGRLIAQQGPIGQIVDAFEEEPESAVIYDGEAAESTYAGGEINTTAYYAYQQPEDALYNKNVTIVDASKKLFDRGITLPAGQTMVIDLGQNMTAIPEFVFSAAQNTQLTMRFAEILNDGSERYTDTYNGDGALGGEALYAADGPKGSVYLKSLRTANATAYYVFSGQGKERYQPAMSFFGYRYIECTATGDVTIYSLRSRALSSVSQRTGFIETNNPSVNRLFLNSVYGQLSNNFMITTGCPQRDERESWTGDAQVFTQTAVYHFDSMAFLNYYQNILSDLTRQKGFPGSTTTYGGFTGVCTSGWDDIEITQPWLLYQQTGDTSILEQNWDAMTTYMNFMITHERANIPYRAPEMPIAFGDWLNFQGTSIEVMTDLYYGYTMQLMAQMAEVLGKDDEAAYYADRAEKMKEAFIQAHVTFDEAGVMTVHSEIGSLPFMGNSGPLEPNSQTALLWMLKLDYFDSDDARQQAVDMLVQNVKNENPDPDSIRAAYGPNTLAVGFLGANVLAPVLTDIGAGDVAYDVILNDGMPSWLHAVENGATTMWERWDSYSAQEGFGNQSMNSFNHFANGSVAEWMYRYMAGIAADTSRPGFQNVILQPVLDTGAPYNDQERIRQVKASYDSYYGTIVSNWEAEAGSLARYETVVPANTTADLYLPVSAASVRDFSDIEGVTFQGMVQHNGQETAHFTLSAGGYVFTVTDGRLAVAYAEGYTTDEPDRPGEEADKAALQAAYDGAKLIYEAGDEDYTAKSWAAFETAYHAAGNLLVDPTAAQPDVDAAAGNLLAAREGLRLKGDLDKNGNVDIVDVMGTCRVLARKAAGQEPSPDELELGDLDGNGRVDISDVMLICRILARQI